MTVKARAFDDAVEFAAASEEFVRADPARSTVLATVLADVVAGLRTYPGSTWLLAESSGDDGTEVVGVAMQTPPHRLWFSAMPVEAAEAVAVLMAGRAAPRGLPGMAGERSAVAAAAGRWAVERPDERLAEIRAMRIYALGTLRAPEDVPGRARVATEDDSELLLDWQTAFAEEAHTLLADVVSSTAARLTGHGAYHVWELDGEVVSLGGHTAQVAGSVRVGPVYTPPGHRRRGYGAAVTAATTLHALADGATQVVLFTDLANPVSNSIYQAIGYVPGADFVELALV